MVDTLEEFLEEFDRALLEEMPCVLCSINDIEDFLDDFDDKGYSLACISNTGTPSGMVRLTFLKKENFNSKNECGDVDGEVK